MEPIKINLNKPVKNFRVFNIVDMIETDDELVIKLKDNEHYGIHVGEKLKFSRNIYYSGTSRYTLSEQVTVLYKDEDNAIHTTRLKKNKIPLYNGFDNISYAIFDKDLGCEEIGENIRFSVIAKEDHNIFPQDLLVCPQEFYFKDKSDNILLTVSGNSIYVPLENSNNKPTSADCITLISDDLTCGRKYKKFKTYQYDFASKNIHKRCFNITLEDYNYIDFVKCVEGMDYIETKYNLF